MFLRYCLVLLFINIKYNEGKGKKHARKDDSEEEFIKKVFNKKITLVIEKLEQQIITSRTTVMPSIS
jgi:hypothetical protein